MYPSDYRYTKEHEWIKVSGDTGTIGITDYAQHELGDVVFVELPAVGAKITAGQVFGTVESVKAVSEIYAPVSGEVTEANAALSDTPETVNTDPHGAAWLIKIKLADPAEVSEPDGRRRLPGVHLRKGSLGLMRYLPKSPAERREMLDAIGARSIENLFASIPEQFRLKEPLNLPGPMSEQEIIEYFRERAAENSCGYTSFLGAGVYNHLRSVVTDSLIQRGEFLTSYTPYQAEISQGTLQAIFEFQTLMCELTGHGSGQRLDVGRLDRHHRGRADGRAADRTASRGRGALAAPGISPGAGHLHAQSGPAHSTKSDSRRRARSTRARLEARDRRRNRRGGRAVAKLFRRPRADAAACATLAHAKGALLVVVHHRRRVARRRAAARRGGHRGDGSAELRPAAELRRPVRRSDRHARKIRAADAGTPGGRNRGQQRAARLRAHAGHARAAHPPREGDVEHLHQSGALRAGRDHPPVPARQGRLEGNGGAESGQGAICARGAGKNSRRAPGVFRAVFQRIRRRVSALGEAGERGIAARENHRAAAARAVIIRS